MKKYGAAPLPFQGQKRRFLKQFKTVLSQVPAPAYIVDCFGGSGLLAHAAKEVHPSAEVVYNDFDGFTKRIKAIPTTNAILSEIRAVLNSHGGLPDKRISEAAKADIINLLDRYDMVVDVDYLTLSTALLFTQNYCNRLECMAGSAMYHRLPKSDYNADGYLEGVKVVSKDWKDLIKDYPENESLLLLDPPYLSTDAGSYDGRLFWKITDYLDILDAARRYPFIYFSSNKSGIFELTDWYARNAGAADIFGGARFSYANKIKTNGSGTVKGYTDIMCDNLEHFSLL